jgi:hypothetical protein
MTGAGRSGQQDGKLPLLRSGIDRVAEADIHLNRDSDVAETGGHFHPDAAVRCVLPNWLGHRLAERETVTGNCGSNEAPENSSHTLGFRSSAPEEI